MLIWEPLLCILWWFGGEGGEKKIVVVVSVSLITTMGVSDDY